MNITHHPGDKALELLSPLPIVFIKFHTANKEFTSLIYKELLQSNKNEDPDCYIGKGY